LSHRHHYFGEGEGIRAKIEMANAGLSDYDSQNDGGDKDDDDTVIGAVRVPGIKAGMLRSLLQSVQMI
jgi:hypothetical protein